MATERATATSGTPAPSSANAGHAELRRRVRESHCAAVQVVYGVLIFATVVLSFSALLPECCAACSPTGRNAVTGLLTLWFVGVRAPGRDAQAHLVLGARAACPLRDACWWASGWRAFAAGHSHPLLHHRISFAPPGTIIWRACSLLPLFALRLAAHQVPKIRIERRFLSKPVNAKRPLGKARRALVRVGWPPTICTWHGSRCRLHPLGGANAAIARPRSALRCARGGRVARRPAHQHP